MFQAIGNLVTQPSTLRSSITRAEVPGRRTGSQWDTQYSDCPVHGQYKSYWVDDGGQFHYSGCPQCARARELKRMFDLTIPDRFKDATVKSWKATMPKQGEVKQAVTDWCKHIDEKLCRGGCIVMSGNPGTGKTHLATAICAHALRSGYTALLIKPIEFFDAMYDTYGDKNKADSATPSSIELMRSYVDLDLLVLDDIGGDTDLNGHKGTLLFDLIDRRYRKAKSTILTTNLPFTNDKNPELTIKGFIGSKMARRIFESCLELRFSWKGRDGGAE